MQEVGVELSPWLWLKLLLVPALCLVLFGLFLLEDACSRQQHARLHAAAAADALRDTAEPHASSDEQPHAPPLPLSSLLHRVHQRALALASRLRRPFRALLGIAPAAAEHVSRTRTRKRSVSSTSSASSSSASSSSFSPHSPSSSPSSSPYPALDPLRVNLHSDGVAHCYRVVTSLSLSDVVSFYLQRCTEQHKSEDEQPRASPPAKAADAKAGRRGAGASRQGLVVPSSVSGLAVSSVVVRYQGRKLPLDESLERLGIPDMAVLEVEPDYLSLFTSIRRACDGVRSAAERELQIEQQARAAAETAIAERQQRMDTARAAIAAAVEAQQRLRSEQLSMKADIDRIDRDTQAQTQLRATLECSLESIDVGEADLRAARLLLQAELESVRATASIVQSEVDGLRAEYSTAVKERNDSKERLRDMTHALEVAEKEMAVWKQRAHKMQSNEAKIDKMERIIAAAADYAERIRFNDAEMARMEADIAQMQQQVGLREEKERELQALKTRTKQLEKESREAAKWKGQVKALEKDAQEASRWKLLVKQGKVREKTLEVQVKELHHWRQRARAFEKEVKLLRGWKREVCEQAVREGKEGLIPEFPLEGGLDSSGGSDLLSSGGSGLGDSSSGGMTGGLSGPLSSGSAVDSGGSSASTASGGRFFDLIRTHGPTSGGSATLQGGGGGGGVEYFDFDMAMPSSSFESDAEFASYLQQQQRGMAEFDHSAAVDDEDMDMHSILSAYAQHNAHHQHQPHPAYLEADPDDEPPALHSTTTDTAPYDTAHFEQATFDDDTSELMKAGTSDKRIKEALARAAYSTPPPGASEAIAGGLGSYAAPARIRSVPTFYPSSTSSAFHSSIVYDEGSMGHPLPGLHSSHAPTFHASPSLSHPFFSSWPAPSSASPLLIIDDRHGQRAASTASTASSASMSSVGMGPLGHPFSLSSPSPFDSAVVGNGDDSRDASPSPTAVHRMKGMQQTQTQQLSAGAGVGMWSVGGLDSGAGPPGLSAAAIGRFNSPLIIIDDGAPNSTSSKQPL